MTNKKPEDALFDTCASCTIVAAGAAFAALLYYLFTIAVSVLESSLTLAEATLRGL